MDIYKTKHYSDNWATPKEIYDFFLERGFHDPCPLDDGGINALFDVWEQRNFVNPPYSNVEAFVDKAISMAFYGAVSVLLVPARTDTKWFQKLLGASTFVYFLRGRLKFGDEKRCAPFPSVFAVVAYSEYKCEFSFGTLSNFFDCFKRYNY